MENKKEMVCIFTSTNYTLEETKEDDFMFNGKIEPYKANVYTREEIIDIIARVAHLSLEAGNTYPEAAKDVLDYLLGNKKYKLGKNYDK